MGEAVYSFIFFGIKDIFCIDTLSDNLLRKVVNSKKSAEVQYARDRSWKRFDVKILINGIPDPGLIIADKDSGF